MPVKVKVCGITRSEDALAAVRAGADFLGFVFYARSPRCVTPAQAAAILQTLGTARETVCAVGVFVNAGPEEVRSVMDAAGLDLAQLHGDEEPALVSALAPLAFKALRPATLADAIAALARYRPLALAGAQMPLLLLDSPGGGQYGGSGIPTDWQMARQVAREVPRLLLAGGLTPENVARAVEAAQPWGVDVSSGVECSPGHKDPGRIAAFVTAAKAASHGGER